uniref:Flp/Fap pilin component n=1 Tax=mine drainage metagenome TaxID=410659 RepID=E6QEB3_9ZZZZ
MKTLKHAVARFVREEEGVTAIEYGLIAGLIAVVIIGAVTTLGNKLNAVFNLIVSKLP